MAHPQMHRNKPPPPVEVGHIANQINAMPVAPAAESHKREIVAKLNDLAAQMKAWAAQVEGFASHLNTLSVQPQKYPPSPSEAQHSSRGAPTNGQSYNTYNTQQYSGSQQYQFQTSYHQYSSSGRPQTTNYPGAQLSKASPVPPGPGSATPAPDELEKTGKRRRRTDSTRKKKDPLAPKRPPSAYILYQNDVRKEMQEKYPDSTYPDVLGKISESWQTLEESKKKVYLEMVERDKLRYEDEKTRYNAGQDVPTRPTPRRPLSSLRALPDPDPDADAEVGPEGEEEEVPEEEQEEQVQPGAKRSKLGSTHEAEPERLVELKPGPRSESQSPEASHQPGYPHAQRTPQIPASTLPQQPQQVGPPQLAPQYPYSQHVTAPQRANPASSLQPQLSPTAHTTVASQPQGVQSSPQPTHALPRAIHTALEMAHGNHSTLHISPSVSHPSPSPRLSPPSSHGPHAPPKVTNTALDTTHPSPRLVHTSPEQAHLQPQPSRNSNPISTMQIPHLTRAPPSENSQSGHGA